MGLEQRLRKHYRFARKDLKWKRLSREERVFVKEFKDVILCRNGYALRVENVCELLQESAIHLSPQVHAYVQHVVFPLRKYLDDSKRPAYQKLARQLIHYVNDLPHIADRALRKSIDKLEHKKASLEARVGTLQEKVKRIPGFSKLYDEHCSLERRYTRLFVSYRSLEEEIKKVIRKRVLRTNYEDICDENNLLKKRLRTRVPRNEFETLSKNYHSLELKHRKLVKTHNELSESYAEIGNALFKKKRYALCGEVYQAALKFVPEQAGIVRGKIFYNIGLVHDRQGNRKSALQFFVRARELLPGDKDVLNAVKVYERTIEKSA